MGKATMIIVLSCLCGIDCCTGRIGIRDWVFPMAVAGLRYEQRYGARGLGMWLTSCFAGSALESNEHVHGIADRTTFGLPSLPTFSTAMPFPTSEKTA
jgi:hypothetical protein